MPLPLTQYMQAVMYRGVGAPNITQRVKIPDNILKDSLLFHPYVIVDGDRPDTIAYHYYGSSLYDWVVLLSNNIVNVAEQWPLNQETFDAQITKEYGSVAAASALIDHYKLDKNKEPIAEVVYNALPADLTKYWSKRSGQNDSVVYMMRPTLITLTPDSYAALPIDELVYWEPVSAYDNRFRQNEALRNIKLIDALSIPSLERTLRVTSTYD